MRNAGVQVMFVEISLLEQAKLALIAHKIAEEETPHAQHLIVGIKYAMEEKVVKPAREIAEDAHIVEMGSVIMEKLQKLVVGIVVVPEAIIAKYIWEFIHANLKKRENRLLVMIDRLLLNVKEDVLTVRFV